MTLSRGGVVVAALFPLLALACALVPGRRAPGALDEILLGEMSHEAGPFVFPHRIHYAPEAEGGRAIPCERCHHDYRGSGAEPPRACRSCHLSHDEWPDPAKPYL